MTDDERIARVFEATDAELRRHYGAQEQRHLGALVRWRDGGPDPLGGISIYAHPEGHWHYVGFGMSEREEKQTPDPAVSGWGFELTFRLRGRGSAAEAPGWPVRLLNDIARYVFQTRKPLAHGHFIERDGDPHARFWGVVADPVLQPVMTVNGRFAWLQLVALSEPDLRRLQGDDYQQFLAEYAARNPLFVSTI
jgi:hypothetical protein